MKKSEDIAREMQAATFLKRNDGGDFSFVHRSFMEFFLARKILDDLGRQQTQVLNTRRFDRKVIYFLTLLDERQSVVAPLQQILTTSYVSNLSENALQLLYWSGRISCGMEETIGDLAGLRAALAARIPASAQLRSANLQEAVLEAVTLDHTDCTDADFSKANLNHTRLQHAHFNGAKLTETLASKMPKSHG